MSGQTFCKNCGLLLDEQHDQPDRQPCPQCGSTTRSFVEHLVIQGNTFKASPTFPQGAVTQQQAIQLIEIMEGDREYAIRIVDLAANIRFVALKLPDGSILPVGIGQNSDVLPEAMVLIEEIENPS